jgi:hypothetical protein
LKVANEFLGLAFCGNVASVAATVANASEGVGVEEFGKIVAAFD